MHAVRSAFELPAGEGFQSAYKSEGLFRFFFGTGNARALQRLAYEGAAFFFQYAEMRFEDGQRQGRRVAGKFGLHKKAFLQPGASAAFRIQTAHNAEHFGQ